MVFNPPSAEGSQAHCSWPLPALPAILGHRRHSRLVRCTFGSAPGAHGQPPARGPGERHRNHAGKGLASAIGGSNGRSLAATRRSERLNRGGLLALADGESAAPPCPGHRELGQVSIRMRVPRRQAGRGPSRPARVTHLLALNSSDPYTNCGRPADRQPAQPEPPSARAMRPPTYRSPDEGRWEGSAGRSHALGTLAATPSAAEPTPVSSTPAPGWGPLTRVTFRFAFAYWILYSLPVILAFPAQLVSLAVTQAGAALAAGAWLAQGMQYLGYPSYGLQQATNWFAPRVSRALLGVEVEPPTNFTGSGDRLFNYCTCFAYLVVAAAATLAWTAASELWR